MVKHLFVLLAIGLITPASAHAQSKLSSPIEAPSFRVLLLTLITWLLVIIAFFAVLYIVWAGFKYVTAGGDAKKAGEAKDGIIHAVIGIAISMTAQLLIKFIFAEFLGVSEEIVGNVFN